MVPFANEPDLAMQDWIMALEIVRIAVIELVNVIKSSVLIVSQSNLYSPFANEPDPPMQDWIMVLGIVEILIIDLVNTCEHNRVSDNYTPFEEEGVL